MKRICSVFLAIVLVLCLFPAHAAATGDTGAVTPLEVIAMPNGDSSEVSVEATDTSHGSYRLFTAAYDGDGKLLSVSAQDVAFEQDTERFSLTLEDCAGAVEYRAFFLEKGESLQPAAQALRTGAALSVTPLARVHTGAALTTVDGVEPFGEYWMEWEEGTTEVAADLTGAPGLAYSLTISDRTTFSALPEGYDPDALLKWGKDPGLGIDILHEHGFTGEGAVIAYIDQPIAVPYHEQYSEAAIHYVNTVAEGQDNADNSMHGPAVLSLLAGKDTGTAPGSEVSYYAHASWQEDQATHAACLYQIIEQNKSLSEEKKITMVAFSDNIDLTEANADQFRDAVAACQEAGIMVWFCEEYGAASFLPMSDRNDPENLTWDNWVTPGSSPELVYVPAGSRTTAATMGGAEYIYWSSGGLSWTMPYMLGLYAIVAEIDPTLTQDQLRGLVMDTAYENSAGMRVVNPVGFVAAALDRVGRAAEADALRADAAAQETYLYAVINRSAMTAADLEAVTGYLASVTDARVLVVDATGFADATSLYAALQADATARGGRVAGVQIFGNASMVPAFSITYQVQMADGVDEEGTFLTDFFYGNFANRAGELTEDYNVMDHFAHERDVDLVPQWPVARLPLEKGRYTAFFEKYEDFAERTGLTRQVLVNFSSPIFASGQQIDDMGVFLTRMEKEFGLLDGDGYRLYGNQRGEYPVTTEVLGDFTAENLAAENRRGVVEFIINGHGQWDNIDRCYYENGAERRESLVNMDTIGEVLGENPYYLDCWTCNNGWGMADNLTTAALDGQCVGMFSATSILSNNGVDCRADPEDMRKSNFYYFYYTYLQALYEGQGRDQAFFEAQSAYAGALLEDSADGIRGEGNYQFNLCNLLVYENFGVLEPNAAALALYESAGYLDGTPEIPEPPDGGEGDGDEDLPTRDPLTSGSPVGQTWDVPYLSQEEPVQGYTVYGLTARLLDNGYVRFTADCQGVAGMYINAFNPPEGDLFKLHGGQVSGQRETFSFDLSVEELQAVEEVTIQFYGEAAERFWFSFLTKDVLREVRDRSVLFAVDENGTPFVSYVDVDGVPEGAALAHLSAWSEDGKEAWLGGYSADETWAEMRGWTLEAGVYGEISVEYLDWQELPVETRPLSNARVTVEQSEEQIAYSEAFWRRRGDLYEITVRGLIPHVCRYTIALYDGDGVLVDRWNDYAGDDGTVRMETEAANFPDGEIWCAISGNGAFRASPDGKELTCCVYRPTELFALDGVKTVEYDTSDELLQPGGVTVHGCTAEQLADGGMRVTLTFTAPAGMSTFIFDPPDGEHYAQDGPTATGGRDTLTFELTAEQMAALPILAINILNTDNDRFFIFLETENF